MSSPLNLKSEYSSPRTNNISTTRNGLNGVAKLSSYGIKSSSPSSSRSQDIRQKSKFELINLLTEDEEMTDALPSKVPLHLDSDLRSGSSYRRTFSDDPQTTASLRLPPWPLKLESHDNSHQIKSRPILMPKIMIYDNIKESRTPTSSLRDLTSPSSSSSSASTPSHYTEYNLNRQTPVPSHNLTNQLKPRSLMQSQQNVSIPFGLDPNYSQQSIARLPTLKQSIPPPLDLYNDSNTFSSHENIIYKHETPNRNQNQLQICSKQSLDEIESEPRYSITVVQQPIQCKVTLRYDKCGLADRRTIDPPPIVQLSVKGPSVIPYQQFGNSVSRVCTTGKTILHIHIYSYPFILLNCKDFPSLL